MIAYDRLSRIVPSDVALANKALQVSLQQISGVSNMGLGTLARTVQAINSNKSLPAISQQPAPCSTATKNYILSQVGRGTGPCGTITLMDCLGTVAGWKTASNLVSTVSQLSSINTSYLQSGYQNVINAMNGVYDYHVPNPAYNPDLPPGPGNEQFLGWACIVPGGPGAGDYRIYGSPEAARNAAISSIGPACNAACGSLAAANPRQAQISNSNWANISEQMGNEQDLQKRAGLDFGNYFANLQANSQTAVFSFSMSLPGYGQDVQVGGAAQFLEAIADYNPATGTVTLGSKTITGVSTFVGITTTGNNISAIGVPVDTIVTGINQGARTITMNNASSKTDTELIVYGATGGQAIISVMRQGQNQTALNQGGVLSGADIPLVPNPAPKEATLLPTSYTVQEALKQIKI